MTVVLDPPHAMYEVFADFSGDCSYVQVEKHGGLNKEKARSAVAANWEHSGDDFELVPMFMCYVTGARADAVSGGEFEECWSVCCADDEGAFPFYQVNEI